MLNGRVKFWEVFMGNKKNSLNEREREGIFIFRFREGGECYVSGFAVIFAKGRGYMISVRRIFWYSAIERESPQGRLYSIFTQGEKPIFFAPPAAASISSSDFPFMETKYPPTSTKAPHS